MNPLRIVSKGLLSASATVCRQTRLKSPSGAILWLLACVSCSGANPNRDLCVAGAKAEYFEIMKICKSESLAYDDCERRYGAQKQFHENQVRCR